MSAEETEERRSEDRLRTITRRNNMTAEETQQRRSEDRLRTTGQVYHKPGSLMFLPNEDAKFLQIYFLGKEEAEAKRRCKLISGTTKSLIESL
ncbi:hypothetical protein AVEN_133112-1 [Araneus ventricosus]|uniref:Uncharacterized protein n=1 Tax=Araneus ventricosus TaxID=182803 RepID=A0A4Y2PVC7_ARAVE|nr:hypothetical protein AVEN_133112-1 [Araneus ventricosus]